MGKIAVNDSTGDRLISRTLSKEGEANWDLIFGKKSKEQLTNGAGSDVSNVNTESKNVNVITDRTTKVEPISRIDNIGQNGNDGLHYEYELDKSTGEVIKKVS